MKKTLLILFVFLCVIFMFSCAKESDTQIQSSSSQNSESSAFLQEDSDSTQSNGADTADAKDSEDETKETVVVTKTATITNGQHNVSATFTFFSNNTLEVSNFYYDGKAPDTYISIGNIGDDNKYVHAEALSDIIVDAYEGETLIIELPQSINTDDYNAVSVYCLAFNDSFGSSHILPVS